jgi:hypothetical protein
MTDLNSQSHCHVNAPYYQSLNASELQKIDPLRVVQTSAHSRAEVAVKPLISDGLRFKPADRCAFRSIVIMNSGGS